MDALGADEDSERLKAWLRHNGGYVVYAIVLGLAVAFGIRYWRAHEEEVRVASASLYGETLQWYQQGNRSAVQVATRKLQQHFGKSPYAALAALLDARLAYKAGDLAGTVQELRWAARHALGPGVRAVARVRLARVLLERKQAAAALMAVRGTPPAGFEAAYAEARGDALLAQGHAGAARKAYQTALTHVGTTSRTAGILRMKLADLAGAST